ncbi:MAG: hypothetical protein LUC41_05915 [Clostridiales bacterium]|nr:hypothetical protein [Clostridiales bacterium]
MEKVGYMGIVGSFSEVAAGELIRMAGMPDAELVPMVCSQNILDALRAGEIDYGVLGITNTTAGPVSEFVKAFEGVEYESLGDYVLPIHHCVFIKPGMKEEDITRISSHPQAFRQTDIYRANHWPDWKEVEDDDTALAAEHLARGILPENTAVICSAKGGAEWGLEMIAENIEDSRTNRTTFRLLKLK